MYYMICGCQFECFVNVWECECCGTDYDLQDARIIEACESHGG